MTILLSAPAYNPSGPDGRGWSRLSLNAHMGTPADQCALRPTDRSTLMESRRGSVFAAWGNYGRCIGHGECGTCPLLRALTAPRALAVSTDRILVRLQKIRIGRNFTAQTFLRPWLTNRPDRGRADNAQPWTWEELSALRGWEVGGRYADEHGEGFWLVRTPDGAA